LDILPSESTIPGCCASALVHYALNCQRSASAEQTPARCTNPASSSISISMLITQVLSNVTARTTWQAGDRGRIGGPAGCGLNCILRSAPLRGPPCQVFLRLFIQARSRIRHTPDKCIVIDAVACTLLPDRRLYETDRVRVLERSVRGQGSPKSP